MQKFFSEAFVERVQVDTFWGCPAATLEDAKQDCKEQLDEMIRTWSPDRLEEFYKYGGFHIYEHKPHLVCSPMVETKPTLVFD